MAASMLLLQNPIRRVTGLQLLCGNAKFFKVKNPIQQSVKCLALTSIREQQTPPAYKHHNHTPLWTAEKIFSAALVPLVPLAIAMPTPAFDYTLALLVAVHSHWGLEAIVVDYIRPNIFGTTIPKIALGVLYMVSAVTLGGLFYFNYNDVGLGQAIQMLWKL